MKIYSIYILNKAGGLIYQEDVNPGLAKLSANDYLVLAGTLHGMHAIASKLNSSIDPNYQSSSNSSASSFNNQQLLQTGKFQTSNSNKSGLKSIETELFNLYVFQSLTGIKFIVVTTSNPAVHMDEVSSKGELSKQFQSVSEVYRKIYAAYSDYVMKDPFYSLDMPIKSPMFDRRVKAIVQ